MSKFDLQAFRGEFWDMPAVGADNLSTSRLSPRGTGLARISAAVASAIASWYMRRLERQAIRALQELDDRTLRDIGVERSGIPGIVRHGRDIDQFPGLRHSE